MRFWEKCQPIQNVYNTTVNSRDHKPPAILQDSFIIWNLWFSLFFKLWVCYNFVFRQVHSKACQLWRKGNFFLRAAFAFTFAFGFAFFVFLFVFVFVFAFSFAFASVFALVFALVFVFFVFCHLGAAHAWEVSHPTATSVTSRTDHKYFWLRISFTDWSLQTFAWGYLLRTDHNKLLTEDIFCGLSITNFWPRISFTDWSYQTLDTSQKTISELH